MFSLFTLSIFIDYSITEKAVFVIKRWIHLLNFLIRWIFIAAKKKARTNLHSSNRIRNHCPGFFYEYHSALGG